MWRRCRHLAIKYVTVLEVSRHLAINYAVMFGMFLLTAVTLPGVVLRGSFSTMLADN